MTDGQQRIVAVDTETSGLHPDDGARPFCVSWAWRDDEGVLQSRARHANEWTDAKWAKFCRVLGESQLVMHNAKFDIKMLRAGLRGFVNGSDDVGGVVHRKAVDLRDAVVWDTMLAAWIMDPKESSALKECGARLWGLDATEEARTLKGWMKSNKVKVNESGYSRVPWEMVAPYARQDAELTLRLYEHQTQRLEEGEEHHLPFIEREMAVMRVLVEMEQRGIGFDLKACMQAREKAVALRDGLLAQLPFKPTPAGARKWFYDEQDGLPHCVTSKGTPSVGECCVKQLVRQGIEGAETWAAYTKTANAISKYYVGFAAKCGLDGRLRTDFKQNGTVSMRFSSTRVNLQALPHDYRLDLVEGVPSPRSLFIAAPGHVMWELDLSQAELRVASTLAQCEGMLRLINEDRDAHAETAKALFDTDEADDRWFEYRQMAKRCNFALIYSVGPKTFRADLEKQTGVVLKLAEAADLITRWRGLYPEFGRINRRSEEFVRANGYVRLVSGRRRWWGRFEQEHKAFNAEVQGGIAEFMKDWMVQVDARWPGTLLLQIHDSICVELQDQADRYPPAAVDEMCALGGALATDMFEVKMLVDSKAWK